MAILTWEAEMHARDILTLDGNEAVARVAYRLNEVIAIYPITPASPMGEWADEWAAAGQPNLWGAVPRVIEMQSEGGAAGVLHGALAGGALATSFTASQGLLLMLPDLYKIAGELTPCVLHVTARAVATHALSIFGDHSDVMAARGTGCALLAAGSVQEAQDFALAAQAASLEGRLPLLHFFDGFRTSHEVAKIVGLSDAILRAMLDPAGLAAQRARALNPERPVLKGSAQNPDVFFQGRERANPYYAAFPTVMQHAFNRLARLTGRQYRLFDYVGDPEAERVIVLMGSAAETVHETVEHLAKHGEPVGVLKVRLYRPFAAGALLAALPLTARAVAVLDRCKEPGADGEPLYKDVLTALAQSGRPLPRVVGGRYGLAGKEFTPGMVKAVFDALGDDRLAGRREFTIGIHDDLTGLSLPWDPDYRTDAAWGAQAAVFWGLGADGTVSANKNSIKIIGESTELHAQGYFVYDSKKSGAVTVSHLRFGPRPIRAAYLIEPGMAHFVACHQPGFLHRYDLLDLAMADGVFLLNTPLPPERVWAGLPAPVRRQIRAKSLELYVIDAYAVAAEAGLGRRINTIMQTCFFAIAGLLPRDAAIAAIKAAVEKSYGRKRSELAELNCRAIDMTLARLAKVAIPAEGEDEAACPPASPPPAEAVDAIPADPFIRQVTLPLIAGQGNRLPVSLMPADGAWPLGTARHEKRDIALAIPVWEADLCTQCGKCVFVCPHAALRARAFSAEALAAPAAGFAHAAAKSKDYPAGTRIAYQVAPEDCTGCGDCVEACPIHDKADPSRRALNLVSKSTELVARERAHLDDFLARPCLDRLAVKHTTLPGAMLLDPLFEFSGACAGCGETPYLRLASQLFGDRMLVANATGCSSIYGGNLPTTPWSVDAHGRGPAWANSLFEDNAEFGLGLRLAADQLAGQARALVRDMAGDIGEALSEALLAADQREEAGIVAQRERVGALRARLADLDHPRGGELASLADWLIRRSVWIVGGDGWAYDIGYGGLDHVLSLSHDVNVLVLDTEVYSNTGGQTSKATPLGAVAKFAAGGKPTPKKDLARLAMQLGHVYVAQVAYGAKDVHTLRAFLEAEAYPGPSLIVAYCPCIAHGVDLTHNLAQQALAVRAGHWPLFRFDPRDPDGLRLDSPTPDRPLADFMASEPRFAMLARAHPEAAADFLARAQAQAERRLQAYRGLVKAP